MLEPKSLGFSVENTLTTAIPEEPLISAHFHML